MAQSNDPGHFFQTTAYLEGSARKVAKSKNKHGNPIKLPSKILAITADPRDEKYIYVAEAAGTVKKIDLETDKVTATYSGPTAPLTSVIVSPYSSSLVFAGCWDKSIWSWSTTSRKPGRRFTGHADFVKAVLVLKVAGKEVLVSGSADATIIVWDVESGEKLHVLKGHTRGVLALVVDPLEYDGRGMKEGVVVFSAGSDREIRRWRIGVGDAGEITSGEEEKEGTTAQQQQPIIAHETSIDSLYFDQDGDLWTASADKSSKCLSRAQNFSADLTLPHPDFVRDVVVDETGGWVVTACRDEEVRVWDRATGDLKHVFEGHFEEVTGLLWVEGRKVVVSVGIDGTVRKWSLKGADLEEAVRERENANAGVEKMDVEVEKGGKDGKEGKESLLTEEEERELAELMGEEE